MNKYIEKGKLWKNVKIECPRHGIQRVYDLYKSKRKEATTVGCCKCFKYLPSQINLIKHKSMAKKISIKKTTADFKKGLSGRKIRSGGAGRGLGYGKGKGPIARRGK